MKKILPLFLLFTGMVNAQIINFPDANFKAKLLDTSSSVVATDQFGNQMIIDTNNDGEIQQSEAQLIPNLNVNGANISSLDGIQYFSNLQSLRCRDNVLTSLDVSSLTNLAGLNCAYNQLTSLNVTGLTNMTFLETEFNQLTSLDLTGLVNLQWLVCRNNLLSSLNPIAFTSLSHLDCGNNQITSLNANSFINLTKLYCNNNQLSNLNLSGLTHLIELNCNTNQLTALDVTQSTDITDVYCNGNLITTLNISGLSQLKNLSCNNNQLPTLNTSGLVNLQFLDCSSNNLTTLDVTGLNNLTTLYCISNQLNTINLNGLSSLATVYCQNNQFTSLNLSGLGLTSLYSLHCYNNNLTYLNVDGLNSLNQLYCWDNDLASLSVTNLPNLSALFCYNNVLTNLTISNLPLLGGISCYNNQLTNLDVSSFPSLEIVTCQQNNLTSLNLGFLANFAQVNCSSNQLTTIDFSGLPNLLIANVSNNLFQTLNFSNNSLLQVFNAFSNPNLESIFIKNGISELQESFDLSNCDNLIFICADEDQVTSVQNLLQINYPNIVCNSYCTFTPGGNFNTITGIITFDADNNGCDASDLLQSNIRVDINDGSSQGATFSNASGSYSFFTQAGVFNLTPNVENPTWFNISPSSATIPFADNNNNVTTQNFCIAPNGTHMDLEVVIEPVTPARPGFNAVYKLVYRNKGNANPQFNSGVQLDFNPNQMTFVSASQAVGNQGANYIRFDYNNLMPFESREILVTFNINSPTATNPVNIGDILQFHSNVGANIGDENPDDNNFDYNQTVVGSYDPNEITCLQGTSLPATEIGKYLYYVVNFENTGNYAAENVITKVEIDNTKYDINTLQVLNTSHPSYTRITGNKVEFIFEGIDLEAASGNPPVGGHGNVLFKIKSKATLNNGDSVAKQANIYFDYNAPIETNLAVTTYQTLSNSVFETDQSVTIYPNPTNGNININSKFYIKTIELYDIQGRILETALESSNTTTLDISNRETGIYFLKINTENGSKVEKIVKE